MSIIALFVFLIEAFLAYPLTQVHGAERLIFVLFMTVFPVYVATCFFVILWNRPLNLYNPTEIPSDLRAEAFRSKFQVSLLPEFRTK